MHTYFQQAQFSYRIPQYVERQKLIESIATTVKNKVSFLS